MMKAYKRLSITLIAVLLCALLPVLAGATAPESPPETADPSAVYVSVDGNDDTGNGSQGNPYATLAKAVEVADDGATIYVMSDLGMSQRAQVWDKSLTITSEPKAMAENDNEAFVITRENTFVQVQDSARSTYNPAMIEVGGETNNDIVASLLLKNIILDDAGKTGGKVDASELYFLQAQGSGGTTGGIPNTEIVQDAIVATYNGKGNITLGEGAVLKNFGGMSAVRLSGGQLTMLDGSLICDDTVTTRVKGKLPADIAKDDTAYYGPAGAIWLQGGTIVMEPGSKINNVVGRAIYNEAGIATIGGTISNCKAIGKTMWQSNNGDNSTPGYVVYLRMGATMTLTETGLIEDTAETLVKQNGSCIYIMGGSKLITEDGSIIRKMAPSDRIISGIGEAYGDINGEIYGCNPGYGIIAFQGASEEAPYYAKIGPSASLHDNSCWYGVIYVQTPGTIDFYGKIYNNINTTVGGGIVLANNGTGAKVTMYPGAEITNNVLDCGGGATEHGGGGVSVRCGTFVMEGGTISNNIVTANGSGAGVQVLRGGSFIMNGGEITGNSTAGLGAGVSYNENDWSGLKPSVQINGGTISDNKMNVTVSEAEGVYTVTGGTPNDLAVLTTESVSNGSATDRYYMVSESATVGNPDVYMQKYGFTLVDPQRGTKLGNASKNGEQALTNASTDKGWSDTLIASFWAQADNSQTWVLSGLEKETGKEQLPVYALVMPTDPEGNVADGAKAAVYAVTIDGDTWRFAVPAGETNGYVVGLVQPTEDYGTLALTVSPTQVTEGEDSHTFQYQAVYTISDNLRNLLSQQTKKDDFTLTFYLDDSLTTETEGYNAETHTLTVTVPADKLDGYTFHFSAETADGTTLTAGDQLVTSAVLSGQVGTTQVTVPAAPAVVEVVAQTPVAPPVTPSEPADPDDTGVSDLLDTENHNQYLFGYPEGTFGPDQNMTRAEVAQMFYNLLVDKNVAITASFEDVPADAWYAKSVNTLASMGIISGVGENRFEPERSITRAEFTSMAMKFTKGALDGTNVFSDVRSGDWFYEAVVGSIQYGWIEGYEDGTFRPENRITRVEVTSIVNKMLGRFADREFVAGHADELNAFSDVTSTHWGYYHIVEATNSHTYTKPSTNVETWTELK